MDKRTRERAFFAISAGIKYRDNITERDILNKLEQAGLTVVDDQAFRDTERLNYLLQYFEITDIGDDKFQFGVSVDSEQLEYDLSFGKYDPSIPGNPPLFDDWTDRVWLRDVIDAAIEAHGNKTEQCD